MGPFFPIPHLTPSEGDAQLIAIGILALSVVGLVVLSLIWAGA